MGLIVSTVLLRTHCHSGGDSREIPGSRKENKRTRYAAGRGRPALPTASPRIGHNVISSVSREIPAVEAETIGHVMRGRGSPALPTASPRIGHDVISSEVEKSPAIETKTTVHEHQKILARAGSAPRNPRGRNENNRARYAGARESCPTDGFAANRTRCHFERSREIPYIRNENKRTRLPRILTRTGSALLFFRVEKNVCKKAAGAGTPRGQVSGFMI